MELPLVTVEFIKPLEDVGEGSRREKDVCRLLACWAGATTASAATVVFLTAGKSEDVCRVRCFKAERTEPDAAIVWKRAFFDGF